ncbi:hypothetical protein CYFUS_003293 [Cystobacter fuscus]|uniref:DUF3052 domain-containing protein n=1 Tax=Cystobacter fuscus TaxID=43 RepID=A0A250J2Y8_9BACT|nr:hypothetical protein [Cystobacter fuscus]ATB37868.1 hypothetical protein CYFUS_003293 [Cystobacter fuscus]
MARTTHESTTRPAKKSAAKKAAPRRATSTPRQAVKRPATPLKSPARPAPSTKPLGQKMLLKPGMEAVVLGAPGDVATLLGELPAGASVRTKLGKGAPFLLVFVRDQAELAQRMSQLAPVLTPTTLLWVAYPKQSSKVETDLNRDRGWESAERLGLRGIAQVAVDATWAATRLRPSE